MRKRAITLALQGGGSHGAFTWGVLDRLLEDPRIEIEGISGASAGAMNAVVLSHGYVEGGREGARQALRAFWERVADKAALHFLPEQLPTQASGAGPAQPMPALKAYLFLTRFFSPDQLNPFDVNPLRDILHEQIDFERLRQHGRIKLFIAATRVSTGSLRLFRNKQLTLDTVLASACLPSLHRAVEIDGEPYWDGGLSANPPIFPLLHQCSARDLMVVLLHPMRRDTELKSADDIWHRLNEISFSSAFFSELQGIALAKRQVEHWPFSFGRLERRLRKLNMHVVEAEDVMSQLSVLSKLNAHPSFVGELYEEGRRRAELWLADNRRHVGVRSSFSLARLLQ